jgi:hypothetical protein
MGLRTGREFRNSYMLSMAIVRRQEKNADKGNVLFYLDIIII